ncbi:MAG TPA: protein translocase subunit SecF [Candidatus Limnocylindria bacterium]|nr:protein translocase subunit SecF [Candidatus Limnocylindria bacterium]
MIQLLVGTDIKFMRFRRTAYLISAALVLATAIWLVVNGGPNYSVDFTGGTLVQIRFSQVLPADQVRAALNQAGFQGYELQQLAGEARNEYMLRLPVGNQQDPFQTIQQTIASRFPGVTVEHRRTESVGPKVGSDLREKAIWAILTSLGAILLYVGFRYEFKFALGAVVALFHDVFLTLGVLCFTNREVSLTVLAALLTTAGFSINDKIVVFDRIRERHKALRKEKHSRMMDIAVNETLSRTIVTNITVLLTALALLFWGGEVLRDFSLAITVGMLIGTYSSILLASALALDIWIWLDRRKGIQAE